MRRDTEEIYTAADGVSQRWLGTTTYDNVHDAEGRLTQVTWESGDLSQVQTYRWGDCDSPLFQSYENNGGDFGTYEFTCRLDGQDSQAFRRTFDSDGQLVGIGRTSWSYDVLGRMISQVSDTGEGTMESEYVDDWTDPGAPGPTTETLFHDGELVETWEFVYDRVR